MAVDQNGIGKRADIATMRQPDDSIASDTIVTFPARRRVLLVASGGGHWIELTRLGAAFGNCHCEFVSTVSNLAAPVGGRPVRTITDSSRHSKLNLLHSVFQLWRIIRETRPDLVVSTGAAPGAAALILARLRGIQTIWIDSIANSEELSLSCKAVRFFADLRLTQWPHLAQTTPHLQYFGQIL
ncbi:glycosyltransferase (PssD)-like protein [Novosphingobium sp. Rr 2-17]|uniref:glycosyltransferase n=1 Tax=Novosphingobium sp. Rr 2-17 TaxID=555793 RepID=UPI000269820A|nr:glycosyltransferase [Novosphingobium sp. Rr 2-17]EIZ79034.1 glycosyltransferase (PssD)-like protein [Novosphingobium sp. Rr 2-17]